MKGKNLDTGRVQKCLTGVSYPASKQELIQHAQSTCGDQDVVSMLKDLPEQTYGGKQDITQILRGLGLNIDLSL